MTYHSRYLISRIQILNRFGLKNILLVSLPRHLLLVILYRHPKCTSKWFDNFYELMDSVWLSGKEILLLGEFNIDLLNVNHYNWQNIIRSYNLSQCITLLNRNLHTLYRCKWSLCNLCDLVKEKFQYTKETIYIDYISVV